MNDTRKIDELLAKFYAADSTQEEIDTLFKYFLHTQPLPEKYADDELLIRSLAMERYCYAQRVDIHKKLLAMENQKAKQTIFHSPVARYAYIGIAAAIVLFFYNPGAVAQTPTAGNLTIYCSDNCDDNYIVDNFEQALNIKQK